MSTGAQKMTDPEDAKFLIIGGGIAGVSCAETLSFYCPGDRIVLITESSLIKSVVNLVPLAKSLARFDIQEEDVGSFHNKSVDIVVDEVVAIDSLKKRVTTKGGRSFKYICLCICSGSRPKLIHDHHPLVLGIRDTETVLEFARRIKSADKILLVGNGGIASEIVFELKNLHIDWVIKDDYISSTFLDPGAAEFLKNRINQQDDIPSSEGTTKRMRFSESTGNRGNGVKGAALGPDWHQLLDMYGNGRQLPEKVDIHYQCEIKDISNTDNGKLNIELTNGKSVQDVDFVVSATGVVPRVEVIIDKPLILAQDGGIAVDKMMRTNLAGIYSAGDCCTANWEKSEHWFQMRLWTQARQMGMMAGRGMAIEANGEEVDEDLQQDFCFEFFGHVTKLFGYQIVLLGRFNGQGLGKDYEALVRVTKEKEYIKLILVDGRLKGAILIGETGLEETFENLLLNQLDLTPFGEDILNPDIDIEDYFD